MAARKFICPIKINISHLPNNFKYLKIGDFKLRKVTAQDQLELFGIKDVKLNEKRNVICLTTTVSLKNFTFILNELEIHSLYSAEFLIEFSDEDRIEDISNLLLAFRLYKSGNIYAPVILDNKTPSVTITGRPFFCKDSENDFLSKKDIKRVSEIFKLIKSIDPCSKIFLALERYKFAVDKTTNDKNSFIEFVSILESLFLDNDVHELSFRFSLITSYILVNSIKENTTFTKLKEIYTVRSQLVHNGESKKYTKENLKLVQDYVSKLMVWYLENPLEYKEIEAKIFSKLYI